MRSIRPNPVGPVSLEEEIRTGHAQGEDRVRTQEEGQPPRRVASGETRLANTWILNQNRDDEFLVSHPACGTLLWQP